MCQCNSVKARKGTLVTMLSDDQSSPELMASLEQCSTTCSAGAKSGRRSQAIKPRIAWNGYVTVREHIHLNDMTEEEWEATWYSEAEISSIRAACCQVVRRLNRRKNSDILSCSCRGLEYRTESGSRLKFEHRLSEWEAVALEQDRQWQEGVYDDERLAQACHPCSEDSTRVAHLLALKDQKWVIEQKNDKGSNKLPLCIGWPRRQAKSPGLSSMVNTCETFYR